MQISHRRQLPETITVQFQIFGISPDLLFRLISLHNVGMAVIAGEDAMLEPKNTSLMKLARLMS